MIIVDDDGVMHKVVPVSVLQDILDKIRAEIEQLPTSKCTEIHRIYIYADDFKENVLTIFDKYKAESKKA